MKWFMAISLSIFFSDTASAITLDQKEDLLIYLFGKIPKVQLQVQKPQSDYPAFVSDVAAQFERDLVHSKSNCKNIRLVGRPAVEKLGAVSKDSRVLAILRDMLMDEEISLAFANAASGDLHCSPELFRLVFANKVILTVAFY